MKHISVMLKETIDSLDIKEDGIYVDLTLGMGGHSSKILKKLKTGKLICFDKDINALENSKEHLSKISDNFLMIHSDFKNFKSELFKLNIFKVDGVLADLGISSPQVDIAERGFSYNKDAILDMRMDQGQKQTAWNIINEFDLKQIEDILIKNANVKFYKRIANAIVENRPINTTMELVEVIKKSLPAKILRLKNPAKAVFQAIRMAVNNELESIEILLNDVVDLLNVDGVVSIITFHSIEDKIVKNFFGKLIKDEIDPRFPIQVEKEWKVKSLRPSLLELEKNSRSKSAKLRFAKKII